MIETLEKTYDDLENDFLEFAKRSDEWGFDVSRVGSCSLTAVQYEGKLYVANSGDSKGVIDRKSVV